MKSQNYSWNSFIEYISSEHNDDYEYLYPLLEELELLHQHPININTASIKDLQQLPFLDNEEIESIHYYIYKYGALKSLGELALIKDLDYKQRQYLSLFVFAGDLEKPKKQVKWKNLWKYGHHETSIKMDIPCYTRDGFKKYDRETLIDNPNKVYLGGKLSTNIRYQYKYENHILAGFNLEKDSGEPFGSYGNKIGYDFYSFHFLLKNIVFFKTLALGDYRLKFGEGLVVNSGLNFGKSVLLNVSDRFQSIRPHASFAETSFFRGFATTVNVGNIDFSLFYSYLPLGATITKDGCISSLKTDGLYRTLLELSKKKNITEQVVGGNIQWKKSWFTIGATCMYQHYDKPFTKGTPIYRTYYPEGTDFLNAGIHYLFRYSKLSFSGETSYSNNYHAWATLNKAIYRINTKYKLMALQRLYTYQYVGLKADAFSEGGAVRNESGFYVGLEAIPTNQLKIFTYLDYFYFPWPKYGIPHTSQGVEAQIQTDWNINTNNTCSFTYRIKNKERYATPYLYNKFKIQWNHEISSLFSIRALARYTLVGNSSQKSTHNYLLAATGSYKPYRDKVQLHLNCAYFNSEDYKAPMSLYEYSLLHTFSFNSFYGEGMRTACTARWNISDNWMLMFKYGLTMYFDRNEIGEGLQRITGNKKNDISLQLRFRY